MLEELESVNFKNSEFSQMYLIFFALISNMFLCAPAQGIRTYREKKKTTKRESCSLITWSNQAIYQARAHLSREQNKSATNFAEKCNIYQFDPAGTMKTDLMSGLKLYAVVQSRVCFYLT